MSGSVASISLFKSDPVSRKTLRYALGIVTMFAVVFTFNWPGAFLVIILGNGFLLGPKPTLKFAFDFVFKFALAWIFAILLSYFFIDYYILYLLIIGLVMLHIYYADTSVLHPILKLAMCIMNMIVPLMWLKSPQMGIAIGSLAVIGSFGALLITIIVFALIPDLEPPASVAKGPPASAAPEPTKKERFRLALLSLAVLYPLIALFFVFNMQSDVLILVYVSLYAAMPGFAKDLSLGKLMVKTTFFGGVIAIFMYEILLIIPMFSFFMLMVFGLALYGGNQVISGGKQAVNIRKGFSAIIFIFGGVANSLEGDVETKMWTRVIQMTIIVIYLVITFRFLERLFPQTNKKT